MSYNKKPKIKNNQNHIQTKTDKQKIPDNNIIKENFFSKYSLLALIFIIILIGIISFKKYLFGDYLFYFKDIGSDSLNQVYPYTMHRINLLKEGFISKWSFYSGTGDDFLKIFPIEPISWFRNLLQVIGINIFGANYLIFGRFPLTFFFHFLLSGIFAFYYFRSISVEKLYSILGALLITFSGFMVVGSSWSFSGQVIAGIFLLFAFEQFFIKNRWYFFPIAFIYLSSNIFILYIYSLFLFTYALFRFLSEKRLKTKNDFMLIGKMVGLAIWGVLMNSIKFVTGFLNLFFSPRVAGSASLSEALSSGKDIVSQAALFPTIILRTFSSDILGCGNNFQGWQNYFEAPMFYIGILSLVLFLQVFIHLDKRKKILFGVFLAFWTLVTFIPYLRHAYMAFTGDYFRFGIDFIFPFILLLYSIIALNKINENFKVNIPLLIGSSVFLILLLFFPYKSIPDFAIDEQIRKISVFMILVYSFFLFLMTKKQYQNIAKYGLLLFVVIELSFFSYKSYSDRVPVTKTEFLQNQGGYADGTIKAVDRIKSIDKTQFFRTEKDYQSGNAMHGSLNDAMAQGYYGTSSYSSFNNLNYVSFLEETAVILKGDESASRWISGLRHSPLLMTFANVKYLLSKKAEPDFLRFGYEIIDSIEGVKIMKNQYYLPFGYTYDKYVDFDDFKTLKYYEIQPYIVENIKTQLQQTMPPNQIDIVANKLISISNVKFYTDSAFNAALKNVFSKEELKVIKRTILLNAKNNFKMQVGLLSGFVADENFTDTSELEKLNIADTTIFVENKYFNFDIYKNLTDELKKDTFQLETFKQARITGKISLSKTKMLFFTIPYDEGWRIKVNGQNKKLQKVNIGFSGIVLPEGEYDIELYYFPKYYKITNFISLFSVILFWVFFIFYIYKKKKTKRIKINREI